VRAAVGMLARHGMVLIPLPKNANSTGSVSRMKMKPECLECRRLGRMLEEAAIHYYELAQHVLALADNDPEKTWASMALRGANEAKDEIQQQFNDHVATHAPEEG